MPSLMETVASDANLPEKPLHLRRVAEDAEESQQRQLQSRINLLRLLLRVTPTRRDDIAQPVADAVREREYALAVLGVQDLLAHLDLVSGELLLREDLSHHVYQPRELAYVPLRVRSYTP